VVRAPGSEFFSTKWATWSDLLERHRKAWDFWKKDVKTHPVALPRIIRTTVVGARSLRVERYRVGAAVRGSEPQQSGQCGRRDRHAAFRLRAVLSGVEFVVTETYEPVALVDRPFALERRAQEARFLTFTQLRRAAGGLRRSRPPQ
jgi:hypothetical protein